MTATRVLTVSTALLALTLTAGAADVPKDSPIIGRWDVTVSRSTRTVDVMLLSGAARSSTPISTSDYTYA